MPGSNYPEPHNPVPGTRELRQLLQRAVPPGPPTGGIADSGNIRFSTPLCYHCAGRVNPDPGLKRMPRSLRGSEASGPGNGSVR